MRAIVTGNAAPDKYPCLLVSNHVVVLFKQNKQGTVVGHTEHSNKAYKIGDSHDMWAMDMFKPFDGRVIIESIMNGI